MFSYMYRLLINSSPMSDLANSTEALDYISIVWRDRVLVAISVVQHRLHFEVLSKLGRGRGGRRPTSLHFHSDERHACFFAIFFRNHK